MSQLRTSVADGKVPYPLFTSAHFEGDIASSEFRVHIENTPHEISMPRFGVNIATKHFGSHWDEGVVTRECPEFPLHYYIGSCGCAFSVLGETFMAYGSEADPRLLAWIDALKQEDFQPPSDTMANESRQTESKKGGLNLAKIPIIGEIVEKMASDRTSVVNRTSLVNNVFHNLTEELPFVYDDPADRADLLCPDVQDIVRKLGPRYQKDVDRENEHFSVCDAGIVQNVNVEPFLKTSRFSDLIIVFDMNGYKSDEDFDYMPIIQSAVHASRNGLPFPPIQVKRLVHEAPAEFLVFEGSIDDCPTILWFTLCNKNFKEIKDYEPKIPFDETMNDGRPFNDFPVYSSGTNFGTIQFEYSELHFQQLHELMYHNVTSCMPVSQCS
uniref:Cytosolic phospholipase A2 n=1 Tax=Phallusia mammillata TaxID=59560 RepID=A0A6F9DN93_9ASCI|nr:cytosolic phospholipase A2 [Phallusia mammillata]